jgi:hypothetical protein
VTAPFPTGYQAVPAGGAVPASLADAADRGWVARLARAMTGMLQGKLNATAVVTLAGGAGSTTIKDARISASSTLLLQPLTAHAAALAYTAPYVLAASQQSGQVVFNHANTAFGDQTFNLLIIG